MTKPAGLFRYTKEIYSYLAKDHNIIPVSFFCDITNPRIIKTLKEAVPKIKLSDNNYVIYKIFNIKFNAVRFRTTLYNINNEYIKNKSSKIKFLREIFRILAKIEIFLCDKFCKFNIDKGSILFSPYHPIPSSFNGNGHITAQMLHDIIPLRLKHPYYVKHRNEFLPIVESACRADLVLTNSEFTKKDFLNYSKDVDPDKFKVTLLGNSLNHNFRTDSERIKNKYGIPTDKKYILCFYSEEPRKNFINVIEAWKNIICKNKNLEISLVAIGVIEEERAIYEKVKDDELLIESIIFTGFISEPDLPEIYHNCLFSIYPSLYEGFGLPVVESMSTKRFCLASNTTSIPELIGKDLPLVNPYSVNDITNQMELLISDNNLISSYNEVAYKNSKKFTWESTGKSTVKAFAYALNKKFMRQN